MVKRFNPQWRFHNASGVSFTMIKLLPSLSSSSFYAKSAVLLTWRSNGLWWHARGTGTPGGRRGSRAQSKCNASSSSSMRARPAGRWTTRLSMRARPQDTLLLLLLLLHTPALHAPCCAPSQSPPLHKRPYVRRLPRRDPSPATCARTYHSFGMQCKMQPHDQSEYSIITPHWRQHTLTLLCVHTVCSMCASSLASLLSINKSRG